MKYKIKEIEFEDGHKEYQPLVKPHWWSMWKSVDRWGDIDSKVYCVYKNLEDAKKGMARYIKNYRSNKVKSTREIEVTINIKEDEEDNVL